jgi:hypothetical protein
VKSNPKARREETATLVRGIPFELKQEFRIWCLRHGLSMKEGFIRIMREAVARKTNGARESRVSSSTDGGTPSNAAIRQRGRRGSIIARSGEPERKEVVHRIERHVGSRLSRVGTLRKWFKDESETTY